MPTPELQYYLKFYLSGGENNTDHNLSLGGRISTMQITEPTKVFDELNWNETYYGYTDYRCVYLKNTHPTKTAFDCVGYIIQGRFEEDGQRSPEFITFQYDPAGVGDGITTGVAYGPVANEETPPEDVDFPESPPQTEDEAIRSPMGHFSLEPGQCIAIWFKRSVPPNSQLTGVTRSIFVAVAGE